LSLCHSRVLNELQGFFVAARCCKDLAHHVQELSHKTLLADCLASRGHMLQRRLAWVEEGHCIAHHHLLGVEFDI
jgi:hypothetical protein